MSKTNKNLFARQKGAVATLCIVFALFSLLLGCETKSDLKGESDMKGENDILSGKWQLTTISPLNAEGMDLVLVNYTPMHIIYEFKANNVLTVSGNVDNNYGGLEIGNHFYVVTFTDISNDPSWLPAPHEVKINNISYGFSFGYMSDRQGMELVCRDECNSAFHFVKK
jgi:hypothetical protein